MASSTTTKCDDGRASAEAASRDYGKLVPNARQQAFKAALLQSLTGEFLDTKFSLFSRRAASGKLVDRPRTVLANSFVLRAASSEILSPKGFCTDQLAEQQLSIEAYGYASDSDLEDEEEEYSILRKPTDLEIPVMVAHDEILSPTSAELDITESPIPGPTPIEETPPTSILQDNGRFDRVVPVNDMAYKTWAALVFYLYTGEISFAPLRSQNTKERATAFDDPISPPSCSPKSMYRLADKYGLAGLKELAKADIKSKLFVSNILPELFSDFASRYREIYEMEIAFFCVNCLQDGPTMAALPKWTNALARGEMPYSGEMLATLLTKLMGTCAGPVSFAGSVSRRKGAKSASTSASTSSAKAPATHPVFNWDLNSASLSSFGRPAGTPQANPIVSSTNTEAQPADTSSRSGADTAASQQFGSTMPSPFAHWVPNRSATVAPAFGLGAAPPVTQNPFGSGR